MSIPTEVDHGHIVTDGKTTGGMGFLGGANNGWGIEGGSGGAGGAGGGFTSSESMYHYSGYHQHGRGGRQTDYEAGAGAMTGQHGHHTSQQGSGYRGGMYDGMALSEGFLHEYYSTVSQTH